MRDIEHYYRHRAMSIIVAAMLIHRRARARRRHNAEMPTRASAETVLLLILPSPQKHSVNKACRAIYRMQILRVARRDDCRLPSTAHCRRARRRRREMMRSYQPARPSRCYRSKVSSCATAQRATPRHGALERQT